MRRYIDMMMIRFMAHETTRFVALRAHCVLAMNHCESAFQKHLLL